MFGFQTWLALPLDLEETDPGFQHVDADALPQDHGDGITVRLLAGTLHGRRAPTRIFSDTLYADLALIDGARFQIEAGHVERALYVIDGAIEVIGQSGSFGKDQLVVLRPGAEIVVKAIGSARMILLGGEPLEGKRHIYWNFVSSRHERIEQAADDWRNRRFPGVSGDTEFIPLPDAPAKRAA
ncbi:pirin family protein [Sphingomonas sp.]|uniref:pirin family protein n=1 Tax=Sphingomonas sp. TaxID=28214 RepID=UPI003D6D8D74